MTEARKDERRKLREAHTEALRKLKADLKELAAAEREATRKQLENEFGGKFEAQRKGLNVAR